MAAEAGIYPNGFSLDTDGSLYIASYHGRIRQITPDGIINTIIGGGIRTHYGDGGLATDVAIPNPVSVALDADNNLFIADSGSYRSSYRIRKVDVSGVITTIAGNGSSAHSGDDGLALQAGVRPNRLSIAADGSIYFSDYNHGSIYSFDNNRRIRRIAPDGIITTVAGTGSNNFVGDGGLATEAGIYPNGFSIDTDGSLYIASSHDRIRQITPDGIINTIIGGARTGRYGDGGQATDVAIHTPISVTLDADDNLFIVDKASRRVRKVDTSGIITTVAGNGSTTYSGDGGPALETGMQPRDVDVALDGSLYIVDGYPNNSGSNRRIRKVDVDGIITTVAGNGSAEFSGDGGQASEAGIYPTAVAVDAEGAVYLSGLHDRIRKIDVDGVIDTIAGGGTGGTLP